MAECKVQGLVGMVGATEEPLSHFASPAEWKARANSEHRDCWSWVLEIAFWGKILSFSI